MTFALDEKNLAKAEETGAACVIVPRAPRRSRTTLFRCDSPRRDVADLLRFFHPQPTPPPGVHPSASIGENTTIDEIASVGPNVTIGSHCRIVADVVLMASVVGDNECETGAGTIVHPNATVYAKTRIGAGVIIHAGTFIGADGLGYFPDGGKLHRWPHLPPRPRSPQTGETATVFVRLGQRLV